MRIDIHAHVSPPGVRDREQEIWPRPVPATAQATKPKYFDAERTGSMTDPDKRAALLEKLGIDHMIVSAGPPSYMYWVDPKVAVPFISWRNEQHAGFCRGHEDRLSFLATIPGQDVSESVAEIDHAIELGARGIMVGCDNIGGRELDDPAFWPLFDKLEKAGLVLFLHPYPMGAPTRAPDPYHLSWGPGYAYQETLAFARLTLGGALDDFPRLKIHITHGCGFVPYQLGRLNTSFEVEPDVRGKKPPEEYLDNFFFDLQLHDLRARRFFYEWAGADRLVVGDNFGGWDSADGFEMLDELQLPEDEKRKIEGENAMRFFGLESVVGT
jgi:aminocarboxymuconate-semialdehyde decarboxylase